MLIVSLILFFSFRFIPGDVIDLMVFEIGTSGVAGQSEATTEYLRQQLGLDVPVHIQYWRWLLGITKADLGNSLWSGQPVADEISARIPISLELGIIALITGLLVALPVGIYSAMRQDTMGDYFGRSIAILMICLPTFWVGTMVIVYPSVWWQWAPSLEYIPFFENPFGNLVQFILPGAILGMYLSGTTMRMTRTMMLEVLRQDYVRTAWSKGLRERIVVLRHALKNALIPVTTVVGLLIPVLIGGTIILEEIFALPGMGRLLIQALNKRDYTIVSGINILLAVVVLVTNLVVDLTYAYLDPRIRYK